MQICFRCDDSTNALLERCAHAGGISKNQLMNNIIQDYLGQTPNRSKVPSAAAGKEILTELRQTHRILAQLLADTNDFCFHCRHQQESQEFNESFQTFRAELIEYLAKISDRLDGIRKDMVP